MPAIKGPDGLSIHGGTVLQRDGYLLHATGLPLGVTEVHFRHRTAGVLGVAPASQGVSEPAPCQLGSLPLDSQQVTVGWAGGSDTKTTTVLPDPQPGPDNTGCRIPEDQLVPWSGGVIRTPVDLTGRIITQPIQVRAGGVVTGRDFVIRTDETVGEGMVVECRDGGRWGCSDYEIDGQGVARIGLGYSGHTSRRAYIHHVNDGLRMSTNSTIEDSRVCDLSRITVNGQVQHPDCVQITGGDNITIRHNTMSCVEVDGGRGNACVQLNSNSPVSDVVIDDNWLDGGNYTINVGRIAPGPLTVTNNRFGPVHRYGEIGRYGAEPTAVNGNTTSDGAAVSIDKL